MTIYVALLDEGTICWRPVEACELELGRFKIESSEPEDESWMFKAGDIVECEPHQFQNGSGLVASRKVGSEA